VLELQAAAAQAVARIREAGAPFFLVLDTYRFSPHSKGDDFRDAAELAERRQRDPLLVVRDRLGDDARLELEAGAERRLTETIEAAEAAPVAEPEAA
jgi:TPP-dependent pyruvate/acetoin dehydrogenase alpha subunit